MGNKEQNRLRGLRWSAVLFLMVIEETGVHILFRPQALAKGSCSNWPVFRCFSGLRAPTVLVLCPSLSSPFAVLGE